MESAEGAHVTFHVRRAATAPRANGEGAHTEAARTTVPAESGGPAAAATALEARQVTHAARDAADAADATGTTGTSARPATDVPLPQAAHASSAATFAAFAAFASVPSAAAPFLPHRESKVEYSTHRAAHAGAPLAPHAAPAPAPEDPVLQVPVTPFAAGPPRRGVWRADLAGWFDPLRGWGHRVSARVGSARRDAANQWHGCRQHLCLPSEFSLCRHHAVRPQFYNAILLAHAEDRIDTAYHLASDFRMARRHPRPSDIAWAIGQLIPLIGPPTNRDNRAGTVLFGHMLYSVYQGARRPEPRRLLARCDRQFARDNIPVRLIPELLRALCTRFPVSHEDYQIALLVLIDERCDPDQIAASPPGCRDRLYLLHAIDWAERAEQELVAGLRDPFVTQEMGELEYDTDLFEPVKNTRHSVYHTYAHAWHNAPLFAVINELGQIRASAPRTLDKMLPTILKHLGFESYLGLLGVLTDTDRVLEPVPAERQTREAPPALIWRTLLQRGLMPEILRNQDGGQNVAVAQRRTVRALLGNAQLRQALPDRTDPEILAVLAQIRSASVRAAFIACLSPAGGIGERLAVFDWLETHLALGRHGARRTPPPAALAEVAAQLREGNADYLLGLLGYYKALETRPSRTALPLELGNLPLEFFIVDVIGKLLAERLIDGDSPLTEYAIRHVAPGRCNPRERQRALEHWHDQAGSDCVPFLAAWLRLRGADPCYAQVIFSLPRGPGAALLPTPEALAQRLLARELELPQDRALLSRIALRLGQYLSTTRLATEAPRLRTIEVAFSADPEHPHLRKLVVLEDDAERCANAPDAAQAAAAHARFIATVAAAAAARSIEDPARASAAAVQHVHEYARAAESEPLALERAIPWLSTALLRPGVTTIGPLTTGVDDDDLPRIWAVYTGALEQCAGLLPVDAFANRTAVIERLHRGDRGNISNFKYTAQMILIGRHYPLPMLDVLADWVQRRPFVPDVELMQWFARPGTIQLPQDRIDAALDRLIPLIERLPDFGNRSRVLLKFASAGGREINAEQFERILEQLLEWNEQAAGGGAAPAAPAAPAAVTVPPAPPLPVAGGAPPAAAIEAIEAGVAVAPAGPGPTVLPDHKGSTAPGEAAEITAALDDVHDVRRYAPGFGAWMAELEAGLDAHERSMTIINLIDAIRVAAQPHRPALFTPAFFNEWVIRLAPAAQLSDDPAAKAQYQRMVALRAQWTRAEDDADRAGPGPH